MQVSVETTGGLERKITVQVPAERVEGEITSRLRDLARRVRMDGFRPGKVPFKVVQRQYDGQVRSEVVGDVMQQTLQEALIQEKLNPAGGPTIEPKNLTPGEALEYSATFEVYPEIELASFDSAAIERPVAEVTDADVDAMLEKLRVQRVTWDTVERAAKEEDQVTISFEGTIDGEPFNGGKADNVPVVLGAGRFIEGFETQLVGAKAGDQRTVEVDFPQDYAGKDVAGKHAVFAVNVIAVSEPKLPEIDDEFARSFGITDGGIEALRRDVRANMQRELDDAIRSRVKQQVMDALLDLNKIDLPKALVEEEIDRLLKQTSEQQPEAMRNLNLPRELFQEQANRRVSLGLLIGEVIRKNEIKLDAERVRTTLENFAETYEDPQEVISAYRKNRSLMREIEGHVIEEQVVDLLLGQARVTDKAMSFDELVNAEKGGAAA